MNRTDIFRIDGKKYDVIVPESGITFIQEIREGQNAGYSLAGNYERDEVGTYFEYEIQVLANKDNTAEIDKLVKLLGQPVDYHICELPYGQESIVFKGMISTVRTILKRIAIDRNLWSGLVITVKSKEPILKPVE